MRTPGHDEELGAGLAFTEGLVRDREDVQRIESKPQKNEVVLHLNRTAELEPARLQRNLYMSSSCGVCGKASIDALYAVGCATISSDTVVRRSVIHALPEITRKAQPAFEHTGALHAATLFEPDGRLLSVREDVGRHNALDKLIGREFLADRKMTDRIVMLSGRVGFELVQKCVMARVPVLAAVGAPSSLAIETARRFNLTLLGFVRDGRFNIYTGPERIL
jgi:FdhD protein